VAELAQAEQSQRAETAVQSAGDDPIEPLITAPAKTSEDVAQEGDAEIDVTGRVVFPGRVEFPSEVSLPGEVGKDDAVVAPKPATKAPSVTQPTELAPAERLVPVADKVDRQDSEKNTKSTQLSPLFPIRSQTQPSKNAVVDTDTSNSVIDVEFTKNNETTEINDSQDRATPEVPMLDLPDIEPFSPEGTTEETNEPQPIGETTSRDDIPKIDAPTGIADIIIPELITLIDGYVHRVAVGVRGEFYVSHNNGISAVDADGNVTKFSTTGAPKGLIASMNGLLACDAEKRAVIRLNDSGEFAESIATKSDGYFLRAPNSIVSDNRGGYYFSDPGYARIRNPIGKVHYINAAGKVSLVIRKLGFPEGVAMSQDGSHLLVVEGQKNQIAEFQILSPGKLGPKKVFCKLPNKDVSDHDDFATGIAVDGRGYVYVAHHGMEQVEIISNSGQWLRSVELPGTTVTDVVAIMNEGTPAMLVVGRSQNQNRGQVWRVTLGD
jgi:gluconolactonase